MLRVRWGGLSRSAPRGPVVATVWAGRRSAAVEPTRIARPFHVKPGRSTFHVEPPPSNEFLRTPGPNHRQPYVWRVTRGRRPGLSRTTTRTPTPDPAHTAGSPSLQVATKHPPRAMEVERRARFCESSPGGRAPAHPRCARCQLSEPQPRSRRCRQRSAASRLESKRHHSRSPRAWRCEHAGSIVPAPCPDRRVPGSWWWPTRRAAWARRRPL